MRAIRQHRLWLSFSELVGARPRGQLALAFLTVVLCVHLVVMVYVYSEDSNLREASKRDAVMQKIVNVIKMVQVTPQGNRDTAVAAISDPELRVSVSSTPLNHLQIAPVSFWDMSQNLRHGLTAFSVPIAPNQWLNLRAMSRHVWQLSDVLLLSLEVMVILILATMVWSVERFGRPLKHIKEAAERLGVDLSASPMEIYRGPKVVRDTAYAMNQMQQRITDLLQNRTQMLAAMSHDLRTPITRMMLRAQMLTDVAEQEPFLKDLREMQQMVEETLALARDQIEPEQQQELDLRVFVSEICHEFSEMGANIAYDHVTISDPVLLSCQPYRLKRAICNILGNAVKYGVAVTTVTLSDDTDAIRLLVKDDGPGLPEQELHHVFEPFYRGEHSRSKETGGCGLGLTVAQNIMASHGGRIVLCNGSVSFPGLQVTLVFFKSTSLGVSSG